MTRSTTPSTETISDSLIEVDRYADRTDVFDSIIASTVDHFWDPTDVRYIDFNSNPMDLTQEMIMPRDFCIELNTAVADKLDEGQQIRLANQNTRFVLSSILHGEQGALSLSASLTQILRDPGAMEYVREPDPRGSASRHGLHELYFNAMGHPPSVGRQPSAIS